MAGNEWIVVACVLIGEVVDRCEFYLELDIPTARRQGERDLRRSLSPVSNG
jgi:hypothetical protein